MSTNSTHSTHNQLSTLMAAAKRRVESTRGKLIFGFDATASREPTWQRAQELQREMFKATSALEVQLAVFFGSDLQFSGWESDPSVLQFLMSQIQCQAGSTQIQRLLRHIMDENAKTPSRPVNAFVFIGDTFEESFAHNQIRALAKALGDLNIRGFFFLERGTSAWEREFSTKTESIYRELATLSHGAYADFDQSSAKFLADLLASVAAFSAGGFAALANRDSEAARLLLTQMKK